MSITIKKFKNIYGIKNISSIIRFKKNNFIYASNGTMKTSFSDGMYKILNNQVIEPEFRDDGLSEFAIDIDGTNYSKQDIPTDKIRTITFKNEFNLNLMIDKNLLYVISLDLQKLLQEKENLRSKIYEQVKVFFNDSPVKSLKKNDQESFAVSNIEIENILNIFEQIKNYDIDHTINDIDLIKFYNDKALILLEEPELAKKIETYNNFIDKKIKNTEIFTNVFGLDQLKDVIDKCIRIHFFDAGHKLNMNSKNYNEIESIKLYDEELKKIYNDQISKDKFESIKRQIKNNATKEMAKYLEQNKHFLKYLPNKKMIDVIIFNQFKIYENYREEIEEMILKFNQINSEIDKVIKNEKNNWEKTIEIYKSRFVNSGFVVNIDNLDEIKLNKNIQPVISIKNKNGQLINEINKKRLSSSEKRCFNILRLILEYENLKANDKLIIILDDVVDSFDYKNKYSILEYIKEMVDSTKNVELFCLTHNFDFFRNCFHLFNKDSEFLFGSNKNGTIYLQIAAQGWFKNYSFYKNMKNSNSFKGIIFCIPFLRNISELISEKNIQNNHEYELLSKYLHYGDEFHSLTFVEMKNIFDKYGVKYDNLNLTRNYWCELLTLIKTILVRDLNDIAFIEKVILAIFLRIFYEITKKKKIADENDIIKSLNNSISVIASNIIHINSFMYEPLIDVSIDEIKKTVIKCVEVLDLDMLSNQKNRG